MNKYFTKTVEAKEVLMGIKKEQILNKFGKDKHKF